MFDRFYGVDYYQHILNIYSFDSCPVKCEITKDQSKLCDAKGVLFEGNDLFTIDLLPEQKPRNQKWFFFSQEPRVGHRESGKQWKYLRNLFIERYRFVYAKLF